MGLNPGYLLLSFLLYVVSAIVPWLGSIFLAQLRLATSSFDIWRHHVLVTVPRRRRYTHTLRRVLLLSCLLHRPTSAVECLQLRGFLFFIYQLLFPSLTLYTFDKLILKSANNLQIRDTFHYQTLLSFTRYASKFF